MESIFLNIIIFTISINLYKCIIEFLDSKESSQEFRGVWSSPWGGDADLITYESEEQFKSNMIYILDTLKMYHMNALIYHVRTHNDALYVSKLNPISPYFKKVEFEKFDPLKWMIDETHKRGIDFHAWMNPYRITSDDSIDVKTIIEKYKNYPKNPASKEECILYGKNTIIMDPGLEEVRNFIADTIIEFLEKYDVEAIHFDDYFYCNMGANGKIIGNDTILNEPDQKTYNDYIKNNPGCPYKNDSAPDKADWRRYQIDLLIKLLKEKISQYNKNNSKFVQFGISPTGIYKNGDGIVTYDENGTAITTGSDTKGQEHYADVLFCDTLKWCNNGWIDYILPQSYWARTHPVASYIKVMDWWDKVLKYKKVNLYSGIGLYISDQGSKKYSWETDLFELYRDLKDVSNSNITDGACIYNFHTLRSLGDGLDKISAKQIDNGIKAWMKMLPLSEIKSFEKIKLHEPKNVTFKNSCLYFDKIEGAKFYIIYKSKKDLKFKEDEIIDIFGDPENKERIEWKENNNDNVNYKYGIRTLSYSNTLGNYSTYIPDEDKESDSDSSFSNINFVSLLTYVLFIFLF